jgi:hypothetical protein
MGEWSPKCYRYEWLDGATPSAHACEIGRQCGAFGDYKGPRCDSMTMFERVAPVIPVRDLEAALGRYRRLGFKTRAYEGDARYGFVDRDLVSLHVSEWHDHDPTRTGAVVYLYVSDAEAVHDEWAQAGVPGRLGEPHDTEYGLREFGYVDPEGTLHRVGSPIRDQGSAV